jgi:hypothetical protein
MTVMLKSYRNTTMILVFTDYLRQWTMSNAPIMIVRNIQRIIISLR